MTKPLVVGIGELLWDCFGDERRPGGAPANVAFHAGQLGMQAVVCSRVGRDPLGDELVAHLEAQGLTTDAVQRHRHRANQGKRVRQPLGLGAGRQSRGPRIGADYRRGFG